MEWIVCGVLMLGIGLWAYITAFRLQASTKKLLMECDKALEEAQRIYSEARVGEGPPRKL